MGKFYSEKEVYIFYSSNIDVIPDEGVEYKKVEEYMDNLFKFINESNYDNLTDFYLVSQIIHFYFVYVHPYFDINGRTSRTLSMWYLLNNKAYPYIIFNRGIPYEITDYYKIIRETKNHHNTTSFLNYMMKSVKKELEKEYLIDCLEYKCGKTLSLENRNTLQYILSMKSILSLIDFTVFYNYYNTSIKTMHAYNKFILPLLELNILDYKRDTKKFITPNKNNFIFSINQEKLDYDKEKIKYIKLK